MRHAMVCASNMNRSMEAHLRAQEGGLEVGSFGVGSQVRLPGASRDEPNVYAFGTPYTAILDDLRGKDAELYTRNGLLRLLERNIRIKTAPERWQENEQAFDVVVTFEESVFDRAVDHLRGREGAGMHPVLVINMDTVDNPEEAEKAAPLAVQLCKMVEAAEEWEDEVDEIIAAFDSETGRKPIYTICFF